MPSLHIAISKAQGSIRADIRSGAGETYSTKLPAFTPELEAELAWMLEDTPRLAPGESLRLAALGTEGRLRLWGEMLHAATLDEIGQAVGDDFAELDICIDDPGGHTRTWPWELMNSEGRFLALVARSFVRLNAAPGAPEVPAPGSRAGAMRIAMVIARPRGIEDVPFRSVASRVMRAVEGCEVQIDVLRPPTLAGLAARLKEAKVAGQAYDVVHFDGHGAHLRGPAGLVGVLQFEHERGRAQAVDARALARALDGSGVRLLLLNACHSAGPPRSAPDPARTAAPALSLAEDCARRMGIDVLAMSHAVYVTAAAAVVSDLYKALANGASVAAAAAFARRRWDERTPAGSVPLGHGILRHFGQPGAAHGAPLAHDWPEVEDARTPAHARLAPVFQAGGAFLPADDALLGLELALEDAPMVQLTGLRGSGRTTLLGELGRWFVASGRAEPERVGLLRLDEPLPDRAPQFDLLLVDDAQPLHGDPLRNLPAWSDARREAWLAEARARLAPGGRVVLALNAPIALLADAPVVGLPPFELGALRTLCSLTAAEDEPRLPDIALLWTGGNPGALLQLRAWAGAGWFASPKETLDTLAEIASGAYRTRPPPLPEGAATPLDPALLFESGLAIPWLLGQFQGRLVTACLGMKVSPRPVDELDHPDARPAWDVLLARLRQGGLAAPLAGGDWQLHPLLSGLMPFPGREQFPIYARMAGHFANMIRLATIESGRATMPAMSAWAWNADADEMLPNLLWAWRLASGEFFTAPLLALSLTRELQSRLLDRGWVEDWQAVLARMVALADAPLPDEEERSAFLAQLFSLQAMEARRTGRPDLEAQFADRAAAVARAPVDIYDAAMKRGRAAGSAQEAAARFSEAIAAAGKDPARAAAARLERARVLRDGGGSMADALEEADAALASFRDFHRRKLVDTTRLAEACLTAATILLRMAEQEVATREQCARGEALSAESLALSPTSGHVANARLNLGHWHLLRGKNEKAAKVLLEAATEQEAAGNRQKATVALYYRLRALAALDLPVETLTLAVQVVQDLITYKLPKVWVVKAHAIYEEARRQLGMNENS